jgi:hypothetical protein
MKISYAILVCNEIDEIKKLIPHLLKYKRPKDEIVVLYDKGHGDSKIEEFLRAKSINGEFNWHYYIFDGDFSKMKNKLTSLCSGDWIFNIDADEMVTPYLIDILPEVLKLNPEIDMFKISRINKVENITFEHLQKWGWRMDTRDQRINFPDKQNRIYKNNDKIKWKNKVHEVLEGYETVSELPMEDQWCLIHEKTIGKQEKQNNLYSSL